MPLPPGPRNNPCRSPRPALSMWTLATTQEGGRTSNGTGPVGYLGQQHGVVRLGPIAG
jgi:hypothetical protein